MSIKKKIKVFVQFNLRERFQLLRKVFIEFLLKRLYKQQQQLPYLTIIKSEVYNQLLSEGNSFSKKPPFTRLNIKQDPLLGDKRFLIRHASSDLAVYHDIFLRKIYDPITRLIAGYKHPVRSVIDGGGYNGFSSIYFAQKFPQAQVYAIEPSPSNFQLLEKHLEMNQINSVHPICKGLWSTPGKLSLTNEGIKEQEWEISTQWTTEHKTNTHIVDTITIPELMELHQIENIDLLKLNIEGGEKALFEDQEITKQFLPKVNFMIIQVHEDIIHKETLAQLIARHNYHIIFEGRYLLAINQKLIIHE
ncbi:hypothetical protein BKI52_32335 [marine bacterium AO1-C]|nr:hypothetical protein BKI52_32335 [marine bacterium AO1-C]